MLVDYISPEKLPAIIVWLDWNVFARWPSLLLFTIGGVAHNYGLSVSSNISHGIFFGCATWIVYCTWRYGYAVG